MRPDVDVRTWLGEHPNIAALLPPWLRRAVEDLYLHAHVRAQMLCDKLWKTSELRDYLDVSESTWRRLEQTDAGLLALRITLGDGTVRWPAGAVVSYLLRPRARKEEG
jgi:hypothetical protein